MSTAYADALRDVTLDALAVESQRIVDRIQVNLPTTGGAALVTQIRDLLVVNRELMRRVSAAEKEV